VHSALLKGIPALKLDNIRHFDILLADGVLVFKLQLTIDRGFYA
jgi:hypothetical protein